MGAVLCTRLTVESHATHLGHRFTKGSMSGRNQTTVFAGIGLAIVAASLVHSALSVWSSYKQRQNRALEEYPDPYANCDVVTVPPCFAVFSPARSFVHHNTCCILNLIAFCYDVPLGVKLQRAWWPRCKLELPKRKRNWQVLLSPTHPKPLARKFASILMDVLT
jgi:hypothetical protein